MATTQPDATGVQAEELQRLLDGRYADLRRRIREVLSQPEFAPPLAIPTAEYRDLVLAWMQTIADEGLTAPGFPVEFGGQGDPGANIAGFETIALGDLSLLVKFGVQFGLWGGAVQQLGTRVHHERYLRPTASLELTGCFAMTETGHGSNVQQLGTTATYDPDTDEFVIDTPDRRGAQGLHRQRRLPRPGGGGVRAADRRRRVARRPRARRAAPGRETATSSRACGSRTAARRWG